MSKVLLVDDVAVTRKLVSNVIADLGCEILQASNGEEALEVARRERPQLILMDVEMPRLDGVETCRRLKADPSTRGITVIMLTGKSTSLDWVRGKAAGADGYMTKPFNSVELRRIVQQALQSAT